MCIEFFKSHRRPSTGYHVACVLNLIKKNKNAWLQREQTVADVNQRGVWTELVPLRAPQGGGTGSERPSPARLNGLSRVHRDNRQITTLSATDTTHLAVESVWLEPVFYWDGCAHSLFRLGRRFGKAAPGTQRVCAQMTLSRTKGTTPQKRQLHTQCPQVTRTRRHSSAVRSWRAHRHVSSTSGGTCRCSCLS